MATLVEWAYEPKLYRLAAQDEAQRKVRSSSCVTKINIFVSLRCRTRMSPVAVAWQVSGGSEREWVDIDRWRRYETRNVMSSRDCEKQMGDIKTIWLWHAWTAWCQTRQVIIDDRKSSRRARRTEHRHTRLVRQDACFRDTSRACCSSVGGGSLQLRIQNVRNCLVACDAREENTTRRNRQTKLFRDARVQRTTWCACWPTSLRWYLWMRLLRWYTWWHKPSGDSSASKQRLQRVPQCGESASSKTMASFAWNFVSCYGLHQTILISDAHWDEGVENEQSSVLTYRLIEFLDDEPQLWSVPDIGKKILVSRSTTTSFPPTLARKSRCEAMRRKSSWPQLCSQKDRANGRLEQMAAKMYVNLRPPGLLPAYGGHAALHEGVGPRP